MRRDVIRLEIVLAKKKNKQLNICLEIAEARHVHDDDTLTCIARYAVRPVKNASDLSALDCNAMMHKQTNQNRIKTWDVSPLLFD